jgi:hypothetical protein
MNRNNDSGFSQVAQVSETQKTQNDKTIAVAIAVLFAFVVIHLCGTCEKPLPLSLLLPF